MPRPWGETWRAHQDRYFAEHGIELRVDATAAHPGEHIGPVRVRKVDSPAVERAEALRTANEAAARDPEQVLAALTRNNATFTERELDRYLAKHLGAGADGMPDAAQVQDVAAAKEAVLGHKDVLVLPDRETGEAAGRFSTRTVREQERVALADGAAVAGARHHQGVKARHQEAALPSRTLRKDQHAAFEHAVEGGGAITWTGDGEAALVALVARWKADTLADPKASRFVFAYTNADVSRINAELRQVGRERGELAQPGRAARDQARCRELRGRGPGVVHRDPATMCVDVSNSPTPFERPAPARSKHQSLISGSYLQWQLLQDASTGRTLGDVRSIAFASFT